MREPQRLARTYHGHLIVSVSLQAMEPHPDGDGWDHEVFGDAGQSIGVYNSLGPAIQCAKRAKYPGKYPEQINMNLEEVEGDFRPVILPEQDEPETDTPEPEETE